MRPERNQPSKANSAANNSAGSTNTPPEKEEKGFVTMLKKAGFTVWLAVMVIGGALAFIVALFLV